MKIHARVYGHAHLQWEPLGSVCHFLVPHFPKFKTEKAGIFPALLNMLVPKDDCIKVYAVPDPGAIGPLKYPQVMKMGKAYCKGSPRSGTPTMPPSSPGESQPERDQSRSNPGKLLPESAAPL